MNEASKPIQIGVVMRINMQGDERPGSIFLCQGGMKAVGLNMGAANPDGDHIRSKDLRNHPMNFFNIALVLGKEVPSDVPVVGNGQLGEYEAALNEALRINSPQFYIDPLSRAAVLGQLGRITQANAALQELVSFMPDFIKIGRKQLRIVVFSEENVEMLWDGLVKAGLGIES